MSTAIPFPAYSLPLVDTVDGLCCLFWTTAYVLYIRQASLHKTFGMPSFALCMNFAWELGYAFGFLRGPEERPRVFQVVGSVWSVLDVVIVAQTIAYGPAELARSSPGLAKMLNRWTWAALLLAGTAIAGAWHWSFDRQFWGVTEVPFWLGYSDQLILGSLSILVLLHRGSTRGHSLAIWLCRWLGSLLPIPTFFYRLARAPAEYGWVQKPLPILLFVLVEVVDLSYPFVYLYVKKREREVVPGTARIEHEKNL